MSLTWVNSAAVLSNCGDGSAICLTATGEGNPQGQLTFEERKDGNDTRGADVDGQFVLPDGKLLDVFGETAHDPRAILVEVVCLRFVLVGRVHHGGLEGADLVARRYPRVGSILREDDAPAGGGCETPHEGR